MPAATRPAAVGGTARAARQSTRPQPGARAAARRARSPADRAPPSPSVAQLVGAIGGGSVILIVPGCLWAKLGTGSAFSLTRLAPPVVLSLVGFFIMIAGTYVTIKDIVSPPNATMS